ncbi:MAG: YggT family protein [Deltaproteobacteria bacterium]|nr:YggT family protein [Deltaproteobacteria bacterium]
MFLLSNFLIAAASVLGLLITLYTYVIIARAILSWVSPDPYNPIVRFLYNITEPVLYRVRRTVPFAYVGGLDFSPLIVLLGLYFLRAFLVRSLQDFALMLR